MGASAILTRKVALPNFFSMTLNTEYARVAAQTFFGGADRDRFQRVAEQVRSCGSAEEAARLSCETVTFNCHGRQVPLVVDVASNNQLLGACRDVGEFSFGYEPEIHCALDILTGADAVIYDIGANWGPISLQAALREGFRGRVFAFEPQTPAYENLRAMVAAAGLESVLFPQNVAVSDHEGETHLTDDQWRGNVAVSESGTGEACRLVVLDRLDLPDPQLIKIDVEGHEQAVLAGAAELLQRARPFVIFEDWIEHPKAHFAQLAGYGYAFYRLGWYNPFTGAMEERPPFLTTIQILGLQRVEPEGRSQLPRRINMLAAPQPLIIEQYPGLISL